MCAHLRVLMRVLCIVNALYDVTVFARWYVRTCVGLCKRN